MVQTLINVWNPERKCFKLGQKEVPFSYSDVALLTGHPVIGKCIVFERSEGTSEVEEVLKGAIKECVSQERKRKRTLHNNMCIYSNYISILLKLCRIHNTVETVSLFKKLYSLLVMSRLLFPQCIEGVARDLIFVVEDGERMREYS